MRILPSGIEDSIELCLRVHESRLPVVAAATGHSMALGAILLLAADHRVGSADPKFKYGMNEASIGMPLPIFAVEMARARMPGAVFTKAVTQSAVVDAARAVDFGFLDEAAPHEEVVQRAVSEAARLGAYLKHPAYVDTKVRERGASIQHMRDTVVEDIRSLASTAAKLGPK